MAKWQYRIMEFQEFQDPKELEAKLNAEGEEQWELVSYTQKGNSVSAVFKRTGVTPEV